MQKMSQRPHSYLNYINMIWRVEWFLCERFFTKFKVHHGSSLYIYPSLPELASGNWIRHSRKYPMNIDDLPEKSWWMLNCNICNGKQRLFIILAELSQSSAIWRIPYAIHHSTSRRVGKKNHQKIGSSQETLGESTSIALSWFWLVSGWALPLWKIWRIVSWDDEIPNIWKVIKFMFQTTN